MPKRKRYYIVGAVKEKHGLEIQGFPSDISLVWADGMVGVLPVFTNKRKAERYAGKQFSVYAFDGK